MFDYLVLTSKDYKLSSNDCWANRLIKKHFDLPQYAGAQFIHTSDGALYLNHSCVLKKSTPRMVFDCCGLYELSCFTQNRFILVNSYQVDLLPFWEEYWPQFRLHCTIPVMFVLARTKRESMDMPYSYVSPNNEVMAKNSIKISSFRNIRYPDHILDVHLMWHPDGTEALTDVNTEWREPVTFPESFLP